MGQAAVLAANDFAAFEQTAWTRQAEGYRAYFEDLVGQAIEPLLDAAGVMSGQDFLDLACGPGFVTAAAARRGANVVGVDFCDSMLALARRRYPWQRFEQGDALDLPFGGASFDAIAINFGVLHFADPHRALREACRVLRPGGSLAFTDWAAPGPDNIAYEIMLSALERYGASVALPPGPPLFQFANGARCREALVAAGFDAVTVSTQLLTLTWRLPSSDGLLLAFRDGSARLGARIKAQPPNRLAAVRAAVRDGSLPFSTGAGIAVPTGVALTSARKPPFAKSRATARLSAVAPSR